MPKPSKERIAALKSEILMAKKFNEEELEPRMIEGVERYTGTHIPDYGQCELVLNEIYPVVNNHLPSVFFRNPKVFLKPRNKTHIVKERDPVTGKMVSVQKDSSKSAKTQEAIINYQLDEINYKKQTRKTLLDALLFPHGVLWHGYKGNFGMTDEPTINHKDKQVFVKRLSPKNFLKDPSVSFEDLDEGKWVGRREFLRFSDVIEDEDLNISKELKGFVGFGEKVGLKTVKNSGLFTKAGDITNVYRASLSDFASDEFKKSNAAKFIEVEEIFLRPTKKEQKQGIKGWILLLTEEQDEPLRVSEWTIKAEGFPVEILMFNPVPNQHMGMADIDTYSSIADQKNIFTNLQIRNAEELTKVWVAINKAGGDEEDIQQVIQGQNTIIRFDSEVPVGDRMKVFSGQVGASNELYSISNTIDKNLQEKSGLTDLAKGSLQSGEESATSVRIRNTGSSVRALYRQDIMKDFLTSSIKYISQLNKQFITFDEAVRLTGTLDIEWSEDPNTADLQADVDVDLDVVSMLPENPEEEAQRLNQTLALMVQGLTDPTIANKIAQEGKTINLTPIIEQILVRQRIKHPDIFRNIAPEESQGFVSVAEVRAASANVQAALQGNPNIPSPPQEGQDHRARLEVYGNIMQIIQEMGESIASTIMGQVIQLQQALMAEEEQKQEKAGQKIKPGKTVSL